MWSSAKISARGALLACVLELEIGLVEWVLNNSFQISFLPSVVFLKLWSTRQSYEV